MRDVSYREAYDKVGYLVIPDDGSEDERKEVPIQLKPDDLLCHHDELMYRADANRLQASPRRAFALVAEGASCQRRRGSA